MGTIARTALLAVLATVALTATASAQYRFGYSRGPVMMAQSYYQPRVYTYTPPRPYFSQNTYSVVGGAIGGAAGVVAAPFTGPAAPYVPYATSAAGAIYGNSVYNQQNRVYRYYSSPPAYGYANTTPYMIQSYPRY